MRSKVDAIFTVTQQAKIGIKMQFWEVKKVFKWNFSKENRTMISQLLFLEIGKKCMRVVAKIKCP